MTSAQARAVGALVFGATLAGTCSAGLGAPTTAPSGTRPAQTYAQRILEPLREIGHVKARTPFCTAFVHGAASAVNSALAYEQMLVDTVRDFHAARLDNSLAKHASMQRLEADLSRLRELALDGRGELDTLGDLAQNTDDEKSEALIDFRNALDGAKARQMMLAKKLAKVYAEFAERPVSTLVNLPSDNDIDVAGLTPGASDAFGTSSRPPGGVDILGSRSENVFDTPSDYATLELEKGLFDAIPGDEFVARDLLHAGEAGTRVLALGSC